MDLNIFDAIIISITLILAIKGYFSGIIKEIAGLFGIVAGVFSASTYYAQAGKYINDSIFKIPNESAINVVGFVAVFLLVWLAIVLIGLMISKILQVARLGLLDRIGGMIFSAGKFFVIVSVIITMLSQIEFLQSTLKKYQKNSVMWPIMNNVGEFLIHIKPEEVKKQVNELQEKVVDENIQHIKKAVENVKKVIDTNKTKGE